jgi:hypothetical protein
MVFFFAQKGTFETASMDKNAEALMYLLYALLGAEGRHGSLERLHMQQYLWRKLVSPFGSTLLRQ